MSGSLPDPDGYRGFAESSSRGDGDDEDEFDRAIRREQPKSPQATEEGTGKQREKNRFFEGMNIADAVFSFTNNARIPDDIPYSPVGKAEPILNDTRSSMKKGLEESARKSRQRTFQRTFDRPTSYRQDLDIAQDDFSGKHRPGKREKVEKWVAKSKSDAKFGCEEEVEGSEVGRLDRKARATTTAPRKFHQKE